MSNYLYENSRGYPVTIHSYSGGSTFRFCRRRYKLEKLDGWRQKENRASTHFGNCIEAAAKFHVDNNLSGGVEEFGRLWDKIKELPDLKYTDKEGSWESLLTMGGHMMQLFAVWWPQQGFTEPKWQLNYKKEIFPGDETYSGLEFGSYTDLRVGYRGKPLIVDIKTSKSGLVNNPLFLQLDPQLSSYSWCTGIPDVGFLVFIKGGTSYDRGDVVTVLKTGEERVVLISQPDDNLVWLLSKEMYAAYEQEQKWVKGNALKALKQKYCDVSTPNSAVLKTLDSITKVRLQFLTVEMPPDTIREAGELIGQDVVSIVEANKRDFWPQDGKGIRFPTTNCLFCPVRGICLKDDKLRDELLVQVGAEAVTKDWLDELLD